MRRLNLFPFLCFISSLVFATKVEEKSLSEVVALSDVVVVGTVTDVSMVDSSGKIILDEKARTGPGIGHEIRYHIDIQEIVYPKKLKLPKQIVIKLWPMWHLELGSVKEFELGKTSFFLLKGTQPNLEPAYPAFFQPGLEHRTELQKLLERKSKKQ